MRDSEGKAHSSRAGLQFLWEVVALLGKTECGKTTKDEQTMLRLLTPLLKLYTAKQSIAVVSEVLEAFGGQGYMEDTDLPRLLRDSQVTAIWEGTTNVLSLDVWRPLKAPGRNRVENLYSSPQLPQKKGALETFLRFTKSKLEKVSRPDLTASIALINKAAQDIKTFVTTSSNSEMVESSARYFAFS